MNKLTHFNEAGEAHMVDVGEKDHTHRIAVASGRIVMQAETFNRIAEGEIGKGDVLGIARIAAIMASKRTSDLIPLCHPIAITKVNVEFRLDAPGACVECQVRTETRGQTGVEMEALTAVQVGLLTIYDMCKAIDRSMCIEGVRLLHKAGGQSGDFSAA